jgi:hypothetical protein
MKALRSCEKPAGAIIGLFVSLVAASAEAQTPAEDERRSIVLFDEARRLVAAQNCPAAVPKLNESLRLHPSIGAHLSLAQCEAIDDPASGWRELKVAERLATEKGDDRAAYAREKAAALEPRLALVHVETSAPAAVELQIDGAATELWNNDALVSPPGEHRFDVRGPSVVPTSLTLVAATGSRVTIHVEVRPSPPAAKTTNEPPPGASQRRTALIVGGVGVAALVTGAILGAVALSKKSDLEDQCVGGGAGPGASFPDNCGGGAFTPDRRDKINSDLSSASGWATASTVAFAIGGVALAAAATVYLTAPTAKATARLQFGPGGALFGGQF